MLSPFLYCYTVMPNVFETLVLRSILAKFTWPSPNIKLPRHSSGINFHWKCIIWSHNKFNSLHPAMGKPWFSHSNLFSFDNRNVVVNQSKEVSFLYSYSDCKIFYFLHFYTNFTLLKIQDNFKSLHYPYKLYVYMYW